MTEPEDRKSLLARLGHPVFIATLLVFLSGACVLIIEIVAARVVARHVGAGLYTWTSIIGVVLAGLTLGNYAGGVLADRLRERHISRSVSLMYLASSVLTVAILWLHWVVFDLPFDMSWPMRILVGTTLAFFLPSVALGAVSPVVAKWALVHAQSMGRTLGNLYAFSSFGAIVGTLLAGFVLVPTLGSNLVLSLVALLLAVVAWLLWRSMLNALCIALIVLIMMLVNGLQDWQREWATRIGLEDRSGYVYFDETAYQTVTVTRQLGGRYTVALDRLDHGYTYPRQPTRLDYGYLRVYAHIVDAVLEERESRTPKSLMIGGGAYTMPRYLEAVYDDPDTTVVEIDEGVTRANIKALKMPEDPPFRILHQDARHAARTLADESPQFDFIFGDAYNHVTVPFHLTTLEYHAQLKKLLNEEGMIISNIIDSYSSARFLGAYVNTLSELMEHVYVFATAPFGEAEEDTFMVVGSRKPLPMERLRKRMDKYDDIYLADEEEMARFLEKSKGLVLTDDYAPVEHMLAVRGRR